jgi:small subunit ribosomal protein S16
VGRKKVPHYRIVVMDSRNRRDGAYLDQIGVYHPNQNPPVVEIREEKAMDWLMKGASPSVTVRSLLSQRGLMLRYDLTKRSTPPDKIAEAVSKFKAEAVANSARRAETRKNKLAAKAKEAAPATTDTPQ